MSDDLRRQCEAWIAEAVGCPPERAAEVALEAIGFVLSPRWRRGENIERRAYSLVTVDHLKSTWESLQGIPYAEETTERVLELVERPVDRRPWRKPKVAAGAQPAAEPAPRDADAEKAWAAIGDAARRAGT